MKRKIEYLIGLGIERDRIGKIIQKSPQIFGYNIEENMKPKIEYLIGLGVGRNRIGKIIQKSPSIFHYNIEENMKPKIEFFTEELGMDIDSLIPIIVVLPQIFGLTIEDTIQPRIDYLFFMNMSSPETIADDLVTKNYYIMFYFSLENRVGPRISLMQSSDLALGTYIKISNVDFSRKYEDVIEKYIVSKGSDIIDCKSPIEKYDKFVDLWQRGDGKEWLLRTKNGRNKYEKIFGKDAALVNALK